MIIANVNAMVLIDEKMRKRKNEIDEVYQICEKGSKRL